MKGPINLVFCIYILHFVQGILLVVPYENSVEICNNNYLPRTITSIGHKSFVILQMSLYYVMGTPKPNFSPIKNEQVMKETVWHIRLLNTL